MVLHYLNISKTIEVESIAQRCDETNVKLFGICLCGDGIQDSSKELCDDGSLNGTVCEPTLPDYKHTPPPNQNECEWCDQKCLIHKEVRRGPYCGDGIQDATHLEECDGADKPEGETCSKDCCIGDRYWTPEGCKEVSCDTVIDSTTECDAKTDKNCNAATCLCFEGYDLVHGVCVPKKKPECNYNGIQDNGETGIDCGGGLCPPCKESCPNAVEFKTPGTFQWYAPSNIVSVTAKVWGAGGAGGIGRSWSGNNDPSNGGAGGGYAEKSFEATPQNYTIIVGSGATPETSGGQSEVKLGKDILVGAGAGGNGFGWRNNNWGNISTPRSNIYNGLSGQGQGGSIEIAAFRYDYQGIHSSTFGGLGGWYDDYQDSYTSSIADGGMGYLGDKNLRGISPPFDQMGISNRVPPGGQGANGGLGGEPEKSGEFPGGGGGGSLNGRGGNGADGQVILCPTFTQTTPVSVECYTSPNPAKLNEEVVWTATVKNGKESDYIFSWNGDRKGASAKVARALKGYSNPGKYSSTVSIYTKSNTDLVATSAPCSVDVGDARGQCELFGPSYHWKRSTQECVVCPLLDTYHWNADLDECQSCFPPFHWVKGSENGPWACEPCPTLQTWNRTFERCECPPGQKTDSVRGCIPDCTPPKVVNMSYTGCECPYGSHESGTQCITCRNDQEWSGWDCRCPLFTHEEFGRCVSDRPWGG